MTSVSFLVVHLLDINDNPPEFERQMYTHDVREDTHVGTSLLRVHATSRDIGVNARITYAITGGNEHGKFRIDSNTGEQPQRAGGRGHLCAEVRQQHTLPHPLKHSQLQFGVSCLTM